MNQTSNNEKSHNEIQVISTSKSTAHLKCAIDQEAWEMEEKMVGRANKDRRGKKPKGEVAMGRDIRKQCDRNLTGRF